MNIKLAQITWERILIIGIAILLVINVFFSGGTEQDQGVNLAPVYREFNRSQDTIEARFTTMNRKLSSLETIDKAFGSLLIELSNQYEEIDTISRDGLRDIFLSAPPID